MIGVLSTASCGGGSSARAPSSFASLARGSDRGLARMSQDLEAVSRLTAVDATSLALAARDAAALRDSLAYLYSDLQKSSFPAAAQPVVYSLTNNSLLDLWIVVRAIAFQADQDTQSAQSPPYAPGKWLQMLSVTLPPAHADAARLRRILGQGSAPLL